MSARDEHRINVVVPEGATRVAICILASAPGEVRQVRIQGVSHALIQQTQLDTVFVIPKRRQWKVKP